MRHLPVLLALAATLAAPATAAAHDGDPRYRSIVRGAPTGVGVEVLNYDDSLELVNRSGQTVLIRGYENEPYVRIGKDGKVERNANSPARYINDERFGGGKVPDTATGKARPRWEELDEQGRFTWHDHRMHWMVEGKLPPAVKDEAKRTKVFDYRIPVDVGATPAAIRGELVWVGDGSGSIPVVPLVIGGIAVLGSLCFALVMIRRRSKTTPGGEAW